jgi:hypothetical protein
MGLMPHQSRRHVFASECYRREFVKFGERFGVENLDFGSFLPRLYLPVVLRRLGYRTRAMVSMPVLNPATILNTGFDSWELIDRHNDLRAKIRKMQFPEDAPTFWLLNAAKRIIGTRFPMSPSPNGRT